MAWSGWGTDGEQKLQFYFCPCHLEAEPQQSRTQMVKREQKLQMEAGSERAPTALNEFRSAGPMSHSPGTGRPCRSN